MHVFSLGRINTHDGKGKDVRPWSMIATFQTVFQNGGGNLCKLVACRLHQMLTAAISEAATAKATGLAKRVDFRHDRRKRKTFYSIFIF